MNDMLSFVRLKFLENALGLETFTVDLSLTNIPVLSGSGLKRWPSQDFVTTTWAENSFPGVCMIGKCDGNLESCLAPTQLMSSV